MSAAEAAGVPAGGPEPGRAGRRGAGVLVLGVPVVSAPKFAETDAQIQALRRHVADQCVAISSSLNTIPAAMVTRELRERWLRELRQAARAMALVEERLARMPALEA